MTFQIAISGFVALYIFMLAGFAGWVIIGHVPAILHTPLMSGSNFVHGIVVVGGIYALLNASTVQEKILGFFAVLLGEDASDLYAKNVYNLLALMMKDNVVEIDWSDEILAKTVLTHAGENKGDASDTAAKAVAPTGAAKHAAQARPAAPTSTAA